MHAAGVVCRCCAETRGRQVNHPCASSNLLHQPTGHDLCLHMVHAYIHLGVGLQIQQHIRDYGASVITRMVLPPGFKKWFDSPQRRRAVYSGPGAGTVQAEKAGDAGINHAVVLAGELRHLLGRHTNSSI